MAKRTVLDWLGLGVIAVAAYYVTKQKIESDVNQMTDTMLRQMFGVKTNG